MTEREQGAVQVSIEKYVDARLAEQERASDLRHAEMLRALDLARDQVEKRLQTMNAIREQLNEQAKTFLPRDEYELKHEILANKLGAAALALDTRLAGIEKWQAFIKGKTSLSVVFAGLALLVSLAHEIVLYLR